MGDSIPLTPWLRQLLFMWARFARPNVERRGLGEPLGSPKGSIRWPLVERREVGEHLGSPRLEYTILRKEEE